MTDEIFKRVDEILKRIENINKFKDTINCYTFLIKSTSEFMHLSCVDNDNKDLKNIVIQWCNNEINRLRGEFKSL